MLKLKPNFIHSIDDFIDNNKELKNQHKASYWYEGICVETGNLLRLPRTVLVEKIAYSLMEYLKDEEIYNYEGKMYGVLLVENNNHELKVIKAFSGLLNGKSHVKGWVSPISRNSVITLAENLTLIKLEEIKQEIIKLQTLPERQKYQDLLSQYEQERQEMKLIHQKRKRKRHQLRQNLNQQDRLNKLEEESRKDSLEKRNFKRAQIPTIQILKHKIDQIDQQIIKLKQQRKHLSRQLQAQMQTAYTLTNFAGETLSLSQLMNKTFIPTGTGDCCAPKLLHYAAINSLKPIAMAEFWWGKSNPNGDKVAGEFYGACVDRCQPLMGFLLSGLPTKSVSITNQSIPIVYEDEYILVVNKPEGLLSVAGRGSHNFDSVESRLRQMCPNNSHLKAVHRLDQDTSGLLVLAKNSVAYQNLSLQFQQRKIKKVYEAILVGKVMANKGIIDLPLWGNLDNRPQQEVNWQKGKPSVSHFQVIDSQNNFTRLDFFPITGRTHQLRVHSASPHGLGCFIKGDRIYGNKKNIADRLYLHAREISFQHPHFAKNIELISPTPF